ncbi:MAG: hypothetical protein WED09_01855 [Homoserinimonas sp.]
MKRITDRVSEKPGLLDRKLQPAGFSMEIASVVALTVPSEHWLPYDGHRMGCEECAILYDTRRLGVLEWQQTALCDTLDVLGSSWDTVVIDTMLDIATGIQFQAVNTHLDHRSRKSRPRSADALRETVQSSPLSTIMAGDVNTDADTDPYDHLTGHGLLLDSWDTTEQRFTGAWGTLPSGHRSAVATASTEFSSHQGSACGKRPST